MSQTQNQETETTKSVDLTDENESEMSEIEQLKAERDALLAEKKNVEQKDLSETEKEKEKLKEELKELTKKPLLDSKLFKEKELEEFDYNQLRAMVKVLDKLGKTGGRFAPPRSPDQTEQKKPIKRWFNSGSGQWES